MFPFLVLTSTFRYPRTGYLKLVVNQPLVVSLRLSFFPIDSFFATVGIEVEV